MKQLFIIFSLFTISVCQGQKEIVNRESFKLNIVADAENNYSMDVEKSPYFVKEKILQIYPSEKLIIETVIKGDSIYSMRVVEKNLYPERTIEVEFSQNAEDRNNIMMMLIFKNPFNKKLNYNALMYPPISQKWKPTSIIPIQPKLQNFETWPYAIITIVLDKWRFE